MQKYHESPPPPPPQAIGPVRVWSEQKPQKQEDSHILSTVARIQDNANNGHHHTFSHFLLPLKYTYIGMPELR